MRHPKPQLILGIAILLWALFSFWVFTEHGRNRWETTPFQEFDPGALRVRADKGEAQAQFDLGWCFYNGQGAEQNFAKAFVWFQSSAKQGYAPAQHNLGAMYAVGQGGAQDYVESYKWLTLASMQNLEKAKESREKFSRLMTEAQIVEGRARVKAFLLEEDRRRTSN